MNKILVSVSGGETSGYMAIKLWQEYRHEFEMIFVFANTSREEEETLIFVDKLSKEFDIPIVWVEAVVNPEKGKGTRHKIVDFKSACRNGDVFEAVIKKYGIPCIASPHCSRELKSVPIRSYARSIGWKDYQLVMGFRKDEPKRVNLLRAEKLKHWYPLWFWNIYKSDIREFWDKQKFKLELEVWQGNCKICYKKSKRKTILQILARPGHAIWIWLMELKYKFFPGKNNNKPMRFFRDNESIVDIIRAVKEYKKDSKNFIDISQTVLQFDPELDEQESCAESCEAFMEDEVV